MSNLDFNKKDIKAIPFDTPLDLALATALKMHFSWIIPSAQALINKEFTLVRTSDGLIDPSASLGKFSETHTPKELAWFQGLFKYLNTIPRGNIVSETQIKVPQYSGLVPLILAAFKMYRDVQYSEWDWAGKHMRSFIDKDLFEAVTLGSDLKATPEELIEAREYTLLVKSGKRLGTRVNPTAQFAVSSKSFKNNNDLNNLPRLRKVMDCQLWVAHPSLRTKYMILSAQDLDSMPEPLVDPETDSTPTKKESAKKALEKEDYDLPWSS